MDAAAEIPESCGLVADQARLYSRFRGKKTLELNETLVTESGKCCHQGRL